MGDIVRSFVAIELSNEIKAVLGNIQDELRPKISGIKWVRPENIHLTLKFLGYLDDRAIESVKVTLNEIAQSAKAFIISLSSPGAFPALDRPRVIWVGIDKGSEDVTSIADAIIDRTALYGTEKEKRTFHPHLTLGRIDFSKDKTLLKKAFLSLKIPQIQMMVSKITLFKSTLTRSGAFYEILYETDLSDERLR